MTHVLLAPDKFKGTLTAAQVADALAVGVRRAAPSATTVTVPVADGGDGTLAAVVAAGFERVPVTVSGPTGAPVESAYARRGDDAVVELADASGLSRLPDGRPAPMTASSAGTGELIAAALDAGCRRVVVGIGGSAGTDGGAGLLTALGARVLGRDGAPVRPGGGGLADVTDLDLSALHPRLGEIELVVASDVDNPLAGRHGAAQVYGPQKGASPDEVGELDAALNRWADVVARATGVDRRSQPGAGAAGGVGFGLVAVLGASVRPGTELIAEVTGLRAAIEAADLVVTGEGSLDAQSLRGKAPVAVARLAGAAGVRVVVAAGRLALPRAEVRAAGFAAAYALTDLASADEAMARPAPLLETIGVQLMTDHLEGDPAHAG
ncbi:glycerate kinase [Luteipulveratus halotolerans]|uniref:Glycerate kinase n=2 Tax=Luteipulveratus halotolerans TaxID=1631356 RepID=A0A0L6CN65_9MICO|nr:glycerate kinase [Luteipulveratus halotolerans]